MPPATELSHTDIEAAAARTGGRVRPVTVTSAPEDGIFFALEFLQHTGTFKARGAQNFIRAHLDAGTFPEAGVTIASGGNAGLACAWAARAAGVPATVFLPTTAPSVKVDRLRSYGARVELVGSEFAEAGRRLRRVRRVVRGAGLPCLRPPAHRRRRGHAHDRDPRAGARSRHGRRLGRRGRAVRRCPWSCSW